MYSGNVDSSMLRWSMRRRVRLFHKEGIQSRVSYIDGDAAIPTLHASGCDILCETARCSSCTKYRDMLCTMYHRWSSKATEYTAVEEEDGKSEFVFLN